jgi:ribosome-binding protein aMBF1 (putative translation factor)
MSELQHPIIQSHGVATHVVVPIEEYRALVAASSGGAMSMQAPTAAPTDAEVDAAIAVWNNPSTQWHDADAILREILTNGVASARKARGLSQADLGAALSASQSSVSRLEKNTEAASIGQLRQIAAMLASHGAGAGSQDRR